MSNVQKSSDEMTIAEFLASDCPPTLRTVSPVHPNTMAFPPVFKGTGIRRDRDRKKMEKRVRLDWSEQTFREMMLDKGIPPEIIEKCVQRYIADRLISGEHTPGKTVYTWTSEKLVNKICAVPNLSVSLIIVILTDIMPQPVQKITQQVVHGSSRNFGEDVYTDEMSTILAFTLFWVTPYAVRKIRNFENLISGTVYGRSLYRTTDSGQHGRRFSESDISDIINRTVLMTFLPLVCRTVPITDKGKGYVIVNSCTVKVSTGEHTFLVEDRMGLATGQADSLNRRYKKYRCTTEQYAAASPEQQKRMITDEMYSEKMASFKLPKQKKQRPIQKVTTNGWWIEYTCTLTGQKFKVFTQSLSRSERLSSYTGFTAELDEEMMYDGTVGAFGQGDVQATTLTAKSVRPYIPTAVFARTLKFVMYSLFEYLFRRSVGINELLGVHRTTKMAIKNFDMPFSLYELLESGKPLNSVQKDVVTVELTLPEHLPTGKPGVRRVLMYRELVFQRTGYENWTTVQQYRDLKERVYSEILECIEFEKQLAILPFTELSPGPGLFPVVEDRTVTVPSFIEYDGTVYSDVVMVSGVIKRTEDEMEALYNNPAIVKLGKNAHYKTVQWECPCWKSVHGDHVYIEQNHDDC